MKNRRHRKKQLGGLVANLFGGFGSGQGMDFISQIGNALQGFNNEPALANAFNQSDALFEGFQNQLTEDQLQGMGDMDQYKPVFDLFSVFSEGMFGGQNYQDGGEVEMTDKQMSEVQKRFGQFAKGLKKQVAAVEAEQNKEIAKQQFNQMNYKDSMDPSQIIPGIGKDQVTSQSEPMMSEMFQDGGFTRRERREARRRYKDFDQYLDSDEFMRRLSSSLSDFDYTQDPEEMQELRKRFTQEGYENLRPMDERTIMENDPSIMGITNIQPNARFNPQGVGDLDSGVESIEIREGYMQPMHEQGIRPSTLTHELAHASLLSESLIPEMDSRKLWMSTVEFDNWLPKVAENAAEMSDEERMGWKGYYDYLTTPAEMHSSLNEIRQMAKDAGLHKRFGEDFTKEDLKTIMFENEPSKRQAKKLRSADYKAFDEIMSLIGGDEDTLLELLNTIAAAEPQQQQDDTMRAQMGGTVPVSPLGQYQYPGQPVIVPTPDGRITMKGVKNDILALQEGGATILPANSGVHQLMPGMVLEIPIARKRRGKSLRGVNSKKSNEGLTSKTIKGKYKKGSKTRSPKTSTPAKTTRRFNQRNKRTTLRNRRGNINLPYGRK